MSDNNYLNDAQNKLSSGKILYCLNLLKVNIKDQDLLNQVSQLELRQKNLNRKINKGIIDTDDSILEENRISNSILLIITNLSTIKEPIIPVLPRDNNNNNNNNSLKWLITGLLAIVLFGMGYYASKHFSNHDPKPPIEDLCKNIVCKNGGECIRGVCKCPTGYKGDNCETRIVSNPNVLVDNRDNQEYKIKKIGSKTWMVDNINFKLPGSKCNGCNTRGRHYNLSMAKKACPSGWSLPSINDFKELKELGGTFDRIVRLAEIEFNGRYGRIQSGTGYNGIGTYGAYWTSNVDRANGISYYFNKKVNPPKFAFTAQGNDQMYSCRCVKDN